MSITVDFQTQDEALDAYLGDGWRDGGGQPGEDTPGEAQWGRPDRIEEYIGGWGLIEQPNLEDPDISRYFVMRETVDRVVQALNMSGVAENYPGYPGQTSLEELPHTEDRQEAEDAYEAWLDDADEQDIRDGDPNYGGEDVEDEEWSEWREIDEQAGWFIFRRQHLAEDREEFFAAGVDSQGNTVFLGPDGEIQDEEHIFESLQEVNAAIQAYASKADNGEHDGRRMPTGSSPGAGTLPGAQAGPAGGGLPLIGPAARAAGGLGNLLLIVAVLIVVAYYLESRGHIDLTDRWGPAAAGLGGQEGGNE